MSGKKGQGHNRFTGQRAAGLGYNPQEDKQRGFGGQKIQGFTIQSKGQGKTHNVSASHSAMAAGLAYAGTSYRDKMSQMTDQERMIEEKKKQIQMKLDLDKQKAEEAANKAKNAKRLICSCTFLSGNLYKAKKCIIII